MGTNIRWAVVAVTVAVTGTITVRAQDWETVDDFALADGGAAVQGVAVDGAGGIYVVGTASGHGIVRYSAVDAVGNVCVAGELINYVVTYGSNWTTFSATGTWFTRQYLAATGQWSTTDLFSYSTNMHGAALGAAIAPSGSAFVVGFGTADSGQQRWVVRRRAAPPPISLAAALEKEVNDLIARAAIARESARMLLATFNQIEAKMEQGESASACNGLLTFIKKVQELVKQGILSQSDGQPLLNVTDNLRRILRCPDRKGSASVPII